MRLRYTKWLVNGYSADQRTKKTAEIGVQTEEEVALNYIS